MGLLWYNERLYVLKGGDIRSSILIESHQTPYSGHPRYQNMISTIKKHFFWPKLKDDIELFIAKSKECQLVKVEHQHPSGLLQPLPILEWKWKVISMDFTTGIPKRKKQNDSIFVLVDNLSKASHFILVKSTYKAVHIVNIFLKEIFKLLGYQRQSSQIETQSLPEIFGDIYSLD